MSLQTRTVKNLRVVGLVQVFSMGLSQIGLLILTRFLSPDDIGLYAIILVIYNLALVVATLGLDSAAVQSREDIGDVLRTAMTMRLIGVALSVCVILAIAPMVADFYGRPEITVPLRLFSFNLFIVTFGFASTVSLTRALRFRDLSVSKVTNSLVWLIVAFATALIGMSYWSLLVAFMVGSGAAVAVLLYYDHYRIRLGLSKATANRLLAYGKYPVAISIVVFLSFNLDKVVVGKWLGPELLGSYFLAYTWGTIVPSIFTSSVNSVMFPTYTHISDDALLAKAYLRTVKYVGYISFPIGIGLAAVSALFVAGVLGPQWSEATAPLAIFSLLGVSASLTSPAGNVFFAKARPDLMWLQTWVTFIPFAVLLLPAAIFGGLVGVSFLMWGIALAALLWVWRMASSLIDTNMVAIAKSLRIPALSAFFMGGVVYATSTMLASTVISLLALVLLGVFIYAGLVLTLADRDTKREMLEFLRVAIRR